MDKLLEMNKFGLSERDMQTIRNIFKKYPEVELVHIFGSRAKGSYNEGSDIDFAIINEGVKAKTISNLTSAFAESTLPYTVDVIYLPTLKHPDLIDHIKRVGIVFYKKD